MRLFSILIVLGALAVALTAPAVAGAEVTQAEIDKVNQEIAEAGMSWTAGHTSVTEMDREQFRSMLKPVDQPYQVPENVEQVTGEFVPPGVPDWVPLPAPEDPIFTWRDVDGEDWTSPVTNQLACGACTIFAAVAAIEGAANVAFGAPDLDLDLSEQNLLDCTGVTCDWGGLDAAQGLNRAESSGVCDEACHPYEAADGSCGDTCADFDLRKIYVSDWGWAAGSIWSTPTEQEIKEALSYGPLTTSFTVWSDFEMYTGGVYEKTASATQSGGHAVVIIGWNDDHDSWYGKNSWGPLWGDEGFFEIKRGEVGFGEQFTAWCQVDASQITGVFEMSEDWIATSLEWQSGATDTRTTALQRTYGEADMQFWVQVDDAPWLSVEPSSGTLGTTDVELTFTFDESGWASAGPGSQTRWVYVVGEHGLSRSIEARLTVWGETDSDTDSDTDGDSDADGDTDVDGQPDAGAAGGGDSGGCGCRLAGSAPADRPLIGLLLDAI